MSDAERPWVGRPCYDCREIVEAGDDGQMIGRVTAKGGGEMVAAHRECIALGIIGHSFGVCGCTGFEHNRAAALELKRRIYASVYEDLQ